MARMGLTEDAAFRALQKTSMDHNRKLVDMAEAALALPDLVLGLAPTRTKTDRLRTKWRVALPCPAQGLAQNLRSQRHQAEDGLPVWMTAS